MSDNNSQGRFGFGDILLILGVRNSSDFAKLRSVDEQEAAKLGKDIQTQAWFDPQKIIAGEAFRHTSFIAKSLRNAETSECKIACAFINALPEKLDSVDDATANSYLCIKTMLSAMCRDNVYDTTILDHSIEPISTNKLATSLA